MTQHQISKRALEVFQLCHDYFEVDHYHLKSTVVTRVALLLVSYRFEMFSAQTNVYPMNSTCDAKSNAMSGANSNFKVAALFLLCLFQLHWVWSETAYLNPETPYNYYQLQKWWPSLRRIRETPHLLLYLKLGDLSFMTRPSKPSKLPIRLNCQLEKNKYDSEGQLPPLPPPSNKKERYAKALALHRNGRSSRTIERQCQLKTPQNRRQHLSIGLFEAL